VRRLALLLFLVQLAAAPVASQSLLWAGYGENADRSAALPTGRNATIGYTLARPAGGFSGVVGLPTDSELGRRWAAGTGWFDQRLVRHLWLNGNGNLFAFDESGLSGAGVGAIGALDAYAPVPAGRAEARLRAGLRYGAHFTEAASVTRLLGRAGASGGAWLGPVELRADLDHWRAEEGGYTQIGARAVAVRGRVRGWVGAGRWLTGDLPETGWDAGLRVSLSERLFVTARGGLQVDDILFWIPPQRSWAVGVQLLTGAPAVLAGLPVPVLPAGPAAATLSLRGDLAAHPPSVAGTFSGWRPLPMQRTGDRWELALDLEPGVYEYAFVTRDGEWFVPEGTPGRKPDGFGGHVAVLIVR
jgi:hypothetical protein